MKLISFPIRWVVDDIFPNGVEGELITYNMFVKILLPQFAGEGFPTQFPDTHDLFIGGYRLKRSYHIAQHHCKGNPCGCPVLVKVKQIKGRYIKGWYQASPYRM